MKKIKICGITRLQDAKCAVDSGAWAIGYIFYDKSERYVDPILAGQISDAINCEKVGVFVNSSVDEVLNYAQKSGITMVQLHGDEDLDFVCQLRQKCDLPIIKAFRVKNEQDVALAKEFENEVDFMLFDTFSKSAYGGTGESFEWNLLGKVQFACPVILSGGIDASNVQKACDTNCSIIDISSGVELSKGIKEVKKIEEIFELIS